MRIRWTEFAVSDLTDICDYIHDHDGREAALRIAIRVYESVDSLVSFPHRGRPGLTAGTRELVFPGLPFVAVYRVHADAIEISRILHGAQSRN